MTLLVIVEGTCEVVWDELLRTVVTEVDEAEVVLVTVVGVTVFVCFLVEVLVEVEVTVEVEVLVVVGSAEEEPDAEAEAEVEADAECVAECEAPEEAGPEAEELLPASPTILKGKPYWKTVSSVSRLILIP